MAIAGLHAVQLFRMVHVDNVGHIAQHGVTRRGSPLANPKYKAIGDNQLIGERSAKRLPDGSLLGDHIPFYFGPRMPMLYRIASGHGGTTKHEQIDIVYIITNVQKVLDEGLDFVFTSAHSNSNLAKFYTRDDVQKIREHLSFDAINARNFGGIENYEIKLKKQAEFLLKDDLPVSCIEKIVVYSLATQKVVMPIASGMPVEVIESYYF